MKVLIIGGTGFISGQIAEKAAAAGHEVVLFNRGLRDPHSAYDVINGDAKNLTAFKADLLAAKPDVVVHCIAYNDKHAADLVSVFEGTKAHVIALSSADCYEAFQRLNRGEEADQPVRETSETSKTKHYLKRMGISDYDKNLMTQALMDAHAEGKIEATVFRVPMVYGPGDHQYAYRHGNIIKHAIDGEADIVMSATEQGQIFTYGYVENVAAAIVHSFGLAQVKGEVYNLGEEDVRTQRRWAELYAAQAGHTFNVRILPPEMLGGDKRESPRNFIMETAKFRADTGFTDPVDLKEAIKRTYDWAVAHPEALKNVRANYASEKALADAYDGHMQALRKPSPPSVPGP
jgi:nucleoside-diphosphate-sugar epimerase